MRSLSGRKNLAVDSFERGPMISRPMGLGDRPIIEKVSLTLVVGSDADDVKLKELERLARERCPGVYCLTQPIPLETRVDLG